MRVFGWRALAQFGILIALWAGLCSTAPAQKPVDRSVATISDGVRTELITYSDLMWQLALQPGTSIDPPSKDDLQRALQTLIDQRLFALEAERIPRNAPTDQEIAAEINDLLSHFPSPAEFERRLNRVGFTSVKDDNFERIIAERVAINKYLDFRFRSFIVITPADEEKYYRDTYVPDFRKRFPGVVVPSLESKRAEIQSTLTESRVAEQIETFLDEAKRRVQIVILSDV
ncbi:MAG TPA: hypothetical protein VGJ02_00575 [Pyrinomonadaceae bacterium]